MTAHLRREDAVQLWREADIIKQEWLDHGLSVKPADRLAAEHSIINIYARISRPLPRFVWVDSPNEALRHLDGLPTLDDLYRWIRETRGTPPLASDLAALVSTLRSALAAGMREPPPDGPPTKKGKPKQPWPQLPPLEALAAGIPLSVVLRQGVRDALHRTLAHGLAHRVRDALPGPMPVCWYGQHDAGWIAYHDVLERLDLARYEGEAAGHLDDWATLTRSCGWWWPGEQVCVVVERPESVHRGQVRYRDGFTVTATGVQSMPGTARSGA